MHISGSRTPKMKEESKPVNREIREKVLDSNYVTEGETETKKKMKESDGILKSVCRNWGV